MMKNVCNIVPNNWKILYVKNNRVFKIKIKKNIHSYCFRGEFGVYYLLNYNKPKKI